MLTVVQLYLGDTGILSSVIALHKESYLSSRLLMHTLLSFYIFKCILRQLCQIHPSNRNPQSSFVDKVFNKLSIFP